MKSLLGKKEKVFIFIVLFVAVYIFAATVGFTVVFSIKYNAPIKNAVEENENIFIDDNIEIICHIEVFKIRYLEDDGEESYIDEEYELKMEPTACVEYLKGRYNYSDEAELNEHTNELEMRVTIDSPIEMQENHYYIRVGIAW